MRLICAYSGIEFSSTYFGGIKGFTSVHPVFELPTKTLLARSADFFRSETTPEERRLHFLALLNSSGLIEWRSYATPPNQLILQHFESLCKALSWLDLYQYDARLSRRVGPAFPKCVITQETRSLSNIKYWIQAWEDAKEYYEHGSRRETLSKRIERRERALTKLINDASKNPEAFSWTLAQWAADSTDFPTNQQVRVKKADKSDPESTDTVITLRDYWISILTNKNIYDIRESDLQDLEEYLTENLEHGSIYAFNVLELVRGKLRKQSKSLGFGDLFTQEQLKAINARTDSGATFSIIPTDTVEQANVLNIASTAPSKEPSKVDYPTHFEYLKARAKWMIAQSIKSTKPAKDEGSLI